MDVFQLRDQLIHDYGQYARSFVEISDSLIRRHVDDELEKGLLWPEPLVQLNPAFEPGGYIDELVDRGLLHSECRSIFRIKPNPHDLESALPRDGQPIRLHRHQVEAIEAASTGANYVLTTGTGSGKSLTYIVPIVDWVLRNPGRGIQAIVVYPMNALANSQLGELEKFLNWGYPDRRGPVRFARYTGQELDEDRDTIIANPPDIILTNYVMLELILTRPRERGLVEAARNLRFLVFDELHTYRGRQGADVALLARRVREACGSPNVQCVGTSATMAASAGTYDEQRAEVARVASLLFGSPVDPANVIGETLRRTTPPEDLGDPDFVAQLRDRVLGGGPAPADYASFIADPLSSWIETSLGLRVETATGRLLRQRPRPLLGPDGVATELANSIDVPVERAADAIRRQLLAGYNVFEPESGLRAFAFRLHQFISRGETVYATIEPADGRFITTEGQRFAPGHRDKVLFPLAFCRECGKEYYTVWMTGSEGNRTITGRELRDLHSEERGQAGFVFIGAEGEDWPMDAESVLERVPEDWLEADGTLKRHLRELLPRVLWVRPNGTESPTEEGTQVWFVPAPFRFCLRCGIAYAGRTRSDFGKLTTLGTGGRSTATTTLSLSLLRGLRSDTELPEKARKLLSFTDNRQDASLQAGHFNDFVQSALLRSALYRAMTGAGDRGLTHDVLAQRVFDALWLPVEYYAVDPGVRFAAREETDRAFRNVLGYRLYRDLKRGWRITSPNLEECGLLRIEYSSLEELAKAEDVWSDKHFVLKSADPKTRTLIAAVLLDYMRRELAIKVDYLTDATQEQIKLQSSAKLIPPWAIDEGERLETASILYPRPRQRNDWRGNVYLSSRSGFAQFLRRTGTLPGAGRLSMDDTMAIMSDLLAALQVAGLVEVVDPPRDGTQVPGYQVPAAAMIWKAGDGTSGFHDPIRVPRAPEQGRRTNPFFVAFYKTIAEDAKGLEAREHTAQVPPEVREEREQRFREARLPVLFCSPTMELGIDIAELNAVNMRNVPPTPANYAQRSGRAGRSGQPALVFTYCATGSPHDQFYFRRPQDMVSGQVSPPRVDLANEDLVRAHVHAIWLSETRSSLGGSLKDVLEVEGEDPSLGLLPSLRASIEDDHAKRRALSRAQRVLDTLMPELADAPWYVDGWLESVVNQAPLALDRACDRWRSLYKAARAQFDAQTRIIVDASRSARDKDQARRLRREAESQLELLTAEQGGALLQSDFYSYRYFASEGFLPGYSFPRLPLSAYIPGRIRRRRNDAEGDFISRPRFLAISEFGPRSFVYHEGSIYVIDRAILPVDQQTDEGGLATGSVKWCATCGYLHPVLNGVGPDRCERCNELLGQPTANLFRLQNVVTRRRERISSDEEERFRQGFEIRTGVRFTPAGGRPTQRTAEVELDGRSLAKITYSDAATLWRVNLGWRRRARAGNYGFWMDTQTGAWERDEVTDPDEQDPLGSSRALVIPYVEDRKNCLILDFASPQHERALASLQAAMKRAICTTYQLEDTELAAEPLPDPQHRRSLLFYESAEGGAGVLRRLVDDPGALARVAAAALEVCHFDPTDLHDLRRAPHARQDCEAACYDCLLSYTNQPDHPLLDRQSIRDLLDQFRRANVRPAPTALPRAVHLERLKNLCQSTLEKEWLDYLEERNLTLPTHAQKVIEECGARPDFYYADHLAVVYVDGPSHDFDDRRRRDEDRQSCLDDLGYHVLRFRYDEDWRDLIGRNPQIFGGGE